MTSREVSGLLLATWVAVACAAPARTVAFADLAAAETSRHTGGPALIVATTESARATIASLRPGVTFPDGVVLVAVFQGQQPTGGFTVRVTRIERSGERLIVHAILTKPLDNAFVTQSLTSPLHVVSISPSDASGLHDAVLLDETGAELARAGLT
jgi:hypothetical protein